MSNPLIGTWRLVSWENRTVDGRISYPLGDDAAGFILYTDDGYMAVAIMRRGRESFAAEDLLGGSRDEKVHAAETYVSYCGRYEYRGDSVIHYVELSLFPNWSGVEPGAAGRGGGRSLELEHTPDGLPGHPTKRPSRLGACVIAVDGGFARPLCLGVARRQRWCGAGMSLVRPLAVCSQGPNV